MPQWPERQPISHPSDSFSMRRPITGVKPASFASLKGVLAWAFVFMLLRLFFMVCLFACSSLAKHAVANDFDVERSLLRIPAGEPSGLTAALNVKQWQAVHDFGVHGYDDSVFWLHLSVQSRLSVPQRLVVRNLYALHDKVDFYLFEGKTFIKHWTMGDTLKDPGWVFADKNFAIPLNLEPHSQKQVYIRIEGINTKMLKTSVITYEQMQESIHWSRLSFGAIYGIMFVMAIYNLIIGLIVKDKAYILYACQVAFFCLFIMTINGDGRYYLWRDYAEFSHYAIQVFGVLYVFFIILFPWYLLKLGKHAPNARYFFYFLGVVELLFALSVLTLPHDISMRIAVAVSMLLSPILLGAGLYLVYKKVPVAGIYTFAWSFYLVGATLVGLAAANIVEMNIFTLNGGAVGGIIEQVLLSIALAKRIHIDRQEKYLALQTATDAQLEVTRQKKSFQELFERAPVGIISLNDKGEVTSLNPKCCQLLGVSSPDQAIELGNKFAQLFSTNKEIREKTLAQGNITDHETILTTQSGEKKHCTVTLIQETDKGETVYEGYITDISERKKAQTILHAMEEERMNALEQLVTGVAHEINTPLGINLTSISFAKSELEKLSNDFLNNRITKSSIEDYIQDSERAYTLMEKNLQQISSLVSRFKQVSFKHTVQEKQTIQLKHFIEDIFKYALEDHESVEFELDINTQENLQVFPDLFDIIIKQLIENSLIHGFKNQEQGNIKVLLHNHNDRIILEYRDNGIGVDDALKAQIFNPFVTSSRGHANHAGLGLYRIYNLVTQVLKGNIGLLNESGFALRIEFDL